MPRRMKRNDIDIILYGDAKPPFTVADPPGTMALNERTGVLYIRCQDMTSIPISVAGGVKVDDPGDGNAIPIERSGHVALVTGGAETRTLADPARPGLTLDLYFKTDGGDCVITAASPINQNGDTVMTFSSVGDHIRLISVEDGADFEWRVVASSGGVVSSYVAVGAGAPRVRMVKLTGTSAAEGSSVAIPHGLADRTKIIDAQVLVSNNTGNRIPPNFTSVGNHEFDFFIDATNVHVYCISGNSSTIEGNALTVLITYEE